MGQVTKEIEKVKSFVGRCVETLENDGYAYVCDGYQGDNSGGKYDKTIQSYTSEIVSRLVSLGYTYSTNHGFGCYDWKFYKTPTRLYYGT